METTTFHTRVNNRPVFHPQGVWDQSPIVHASTLRDSMENHGTQDAVRFHLNKERAYGEIGHPERALWVVTGQAREARSLMERGMGHSLEGELCKVEDEIPLLTAHLIEAVDDCYSLTSQRIGAGTGLETHLSDIYPADALSDQLQRLGVLFRENVPIDVDEISFATFGMMRWEKIPAILLDLERELKKLLSSTNITNEMPHTMLTSFSVNLTYQETLVAMQNLLSFIAVGLPEEKGANRVDEARTNANEGNAKSVVARLAGQNGVALSRVNSFTNTVVLDADVRLRLREKIEDCKHLLGQLQNRI